MAGAMAVRSKRNGFLYAGPCVQSPVCLHGGCYLGLTCLVLLFFFLTEAWNM